MKQRLAERAARAKGRNRSSWPRKPPGSKRTNVQGFAGAKSERTKSKRR